MKNGTSPRPRPRPRPGPSPRCTTRRSSGRVFDSLQKLCDALAVTRSLGLLQPKKVTRALPRDIRKFVDAVLFARGRLDAPECRVAGEDDAIETNVARRTIQPLHVSHALTITDQNNFAAPFVCRETQAPAAPWFLIHYACFEGGQRGLAEEDEEGAEGRGEGGEGKRQAPNKNTSVFARGGKKGMLTAQTRDAQSD